MDAMADRYVVSQLVQFAVDIHRVPVGAGVGVQRQAIGTWLINISSGSKQQRSNLLAAAKKELQRGDTGATNRAVSSRIAGMRRRAFRKCLRQKIAAII